MLTELPLPSETRVGAFIKMATVVQVDDAKHIKVRFCDQEKSQVSVAVFAMGNLPLPRVGNQVLVTGESRKDIFIIGVLPDPASNTFPLTATKDPETGNTVIAIPDGNLDIRAEQGDIRLQAARQMEIKSPAFSLFTTKGIIHMAHASYQGLGLEACVTKSKWMIGKLNSTVDRLVEKAKNVYRQVENLHQLKAGRSRTLIEGNAHLKAKRIIEKAEKDVRIDGDRINLG